MFCDYDICRRNEIQFYSKWLNAIGNISYEIYLIQGLVYMFTRYVCGDSEAFYLVFLVGLIIAAKIMNSLSCGVQKLLKSAFNKTT